MDFDTFNNYPYNDVDDNQIGIDINSMDSTFTYNLCDDQVARHSFPWIGQFITISYILASS
jgi:hypothetical protein